MFFTSAEHKERFLQSIQDIGKVYDGRLDQEYGAALYVLTSSTGTWEKVNSYIHRHSLDIEGILNEVHLSHGYEILIKLAGNLFNGNEHIDPLDFMILDEENFNVALTALQLRRYSHREDEI